MVDVLGIACGHIYYYLEDVFPNVEGGFHIIQTPSLLKRLFDPVREEITTDNDQGGDGPGGFDWGDNEQERWLKQIQGQKVTILDIIILASRIFIFSSVYTGFGAAGGFYRSKSIFIFSSVQYRPVIKNNFFSTRYIDNFSNFAKKNFCTKIIFYDT